MQGIEIEKKYKIKQLPKDLEKQNSFQRYQTADNRCGSGR